MRQRRAKRACGGRSTNAARRRIDDWRHGLKRPAFIGELGGLLAWPNGSQWRRALPLLIIATLALGITAKASGLIIWQPQPLTLALIGVAAMLLVIPAFVEELLFRGVLHPSSRAKHRTVRMAFTALLFILWHTLQFWTGLGPEWSHVFVTLPFLASVSILSINLTLMREISRSLWPAILFHWAVICAWKLLFSGPF